MILFVYWFIVCFFSSGSVNSIDYACLFHQSMPSTKYRICYIVDAQLNMHSVNVNQFVFLLCSELSNGFPSHIGKKQKSLQYSLSCYTTYLIYLLFLLLLLTPANLTYLFLRNTKHTPFSLRLLFSLPGMLVSQISMWLNPSSQHKWGLPSSL